jgi:molecular chaperone DnaK
MDRIVGIDFGTKTSQVAVMNGRDPVIIENSEGQRHTPSCVAITESGDVLVGEPAHRQTLVNVANSISNVKSLVGRRYDDPLIEPIKQNSPYNLINKHGDVWVELARHPYSPEAICAFILRKLKQDAETYLGAAVTQAVIAAPSYFNGKQREAMKAAARLAGLETLTAHQRAECCGSVLRNRN